LGIVLFAYFKADDLIFPCLPPSYEKLNNSFELSLSNGQVIQAAYWPAERVQSPYVLIYSPGNAQDLGQILDYAKRFAKLGVNVVGYEYPGMGHSSGVPSESIVYEAIQCVYNYVVDELHVLPEHILLYGFSLGGGPSVDLATKEKVGGVMLEGAFASAFRVMTYWKILPWDSFDNLSKISRIEAPVLIIHGLADTTVLPIHSQWLLEKTKAPVLSLFVKGAHHSNAGDIDPEGYYNAWVQFTRLCKMHLDE
jgi:fermentation-respiration switch protein FrsA (DUF1100 family)